VTQLLAESLVLAAAGGAGAVALAQIGLSLLQQMDGFAMPRGETIALDARVFAVTAASVVLTGIVAGIVPAIRAARVDPHSALRSVRGLGPTVSARRIRTLIVAGQLAVTLALAVSAGLLLRSFTRLTTVDSGFDPRNVVLAQVTLAGSRYEPERWSAYVDKGLEEVRSLPGVIAVGAGSPLPLSGQQGLLRFGVKLPGRPALPSGRSDRTYLRWVTPGYFAAIGVPLTSGRDFDSRDRAAGTPVAIVDKTFVDRYFDGQEPIGTDLQMSNERVARRIIAVAGAVRPVGLDQPSEPHVYIPHAQNPSPLMTFVVKTSVEPDTLTPAVRERLRAVDPARPVYNIRTAESMVDETVAPRRVNTLLVALFAALAAVLSVVGMYGLMAGWVAESTKELGVRLALGAERREVIALVVRRALWTTMAGVGMGLPLALASTSLVQAMLFGVGPRDFPTILAACGVLFAVGIAGAYIPALRAVAVNPVDSLRAE
jgi:predicted permease